MDKFLRDWRQDAVNKHQYESAIFIGDKLLALTNDDKDAFWLAQVHFSNGNYTRAQSFLSKKDLIERNPSCKYLAAHCFIKQNRFAEALNLLGDKNATHLISSLGDGRRKVQHTNRTGSVHSSRAISRSRRNSNDGEEVREDHDSIRFEAAMCYLRGLCYAKQNAFDRAKECYKDAVAIDVQCYEAFEQLMKNHLLSPDEEWLFLESLNFDSISTSDNPAIAQEAAEFTRILYTTRLSKYKNPATFTHATETLSTHYNLANNPDLLLAKADLLFTQCRFRDALSITTTVLEEDKYNFSIYPLHLSCLFELNLKNQLFLISHDLADTHPLEPVSWLAVGIYYLSIERIPEARRYFSKSSMMDPSFGPAWIGFAHTFAAEGEHDQAIAAYSTAARLFMGTHLPPLFLGMQNLCLNNMTVASEFLKTAHSLCSADPLLLNEIGVCHYHQGDFEQAIQSFITALEVTNAIDSDPTHFLSIHGNLGHAYRRLGRFDEALEQYEEVLRAGGMDINIFCAKALVLMEVKRTFDAIGILHEALAIAPQDTVANDLLCKALEETAHSGISDLHNSKDQEYLAFERNLEARKTNGAKAGIRTRTIAGHGRTDANPSMAPKGLGRGAAGSRRKYHSLEHDPQILDSSMLLNSEEEDE